MPEILGPINISYPDPFLYKLLESSVERLLGTFKRYVELVWETLVVQACCKKEDATGKLYDAYASASIT